MRSIVSLLAGLAFASPALAQGSATYDVVFDATWSAQTHPNAYVPSAHFSQLVGVVHSNLISVWGQGGLSSNGMEAMAETGATAPLIQEFGVSLSAGFALAVVLGGGVPVSPGQASATFTVTTGFPLITLVTMVAPSPDWFVGVHDLPLLGPEGWVDDLVVPLFAYDAGTDSGADLTSPNQDTVPQEPIGLLTSGPFFGTTPLGTLRFERRYGSLPFGGNPAASLFVVSGSPVVGSTFDLRLTDPIGAFPTPAIAVLALSLTAPPPLSLPGFGLAVPGTPGELLIGAPFLVLSPGTFTGAQLTQTIAVPNKPGLVGLDLFAQGALADASTLLTGLTQAVAIHVGS